MDTSRYNLPVSQSHSTKQCLNQTQTVSFNTDGDGNSSMTKDTILITIDAFRRDCLSYLSPDSESPASTPFLNSLAETSLLFKRHISTGSGTSTSFPGVHTSSLPLTHGYAGLNQNHTSLAEVLQQNSVRTLGVTAQTSCSSLYDYDRGFDVFEDWVEEEGLAGESTSLTSKVKSSTKELIKNNAALAPLGARIYQQFRQFSEDRCPYRRATEVTNTTLTLAKDELEEDEPFFIWVHFMEPHYPYHPPEKTVEKFHDSDWTSAEINELILRINLSRSDIADGSMIEQVNEEEINALRDYYAAAARYVDAEIERLFEGLEQQGFLEETSVFVTSDHGEELFDHGDLGHRPKMYDELINVPLIYYNPDGSFYTGKIEGVTSHLDIAPTITDLLEIESPTKWEGKSLIKCIEEGKSPPREYAIAELCHEGGLGGSVDLDKYVGAVRTQRSKYIQNRQLDKEQLYDLVKDSEEQKNVIEDFPDKMNELEGILENRLARVTERNIDKEMSDEARNRLKELGYIDE